MHKFQVQQPHQTHHIRRTFRNRFTVITHRWKSRSYTSYKVGLNTRTLPELWVLHDIFLDSEKDRWPNHTLTSSTFESKISNLCERAHGRLQSWSRWLARAELRTEQRLYIGELPDSPDSSEHAPSTNESDEDDFGYGAFIDRANQRSKLKQTSSSTTTLSWANGSWSEQINHGKVIGNNLAGWHSQDLWDSSEYHNWAVATLIQKDHSQETDGHT